MWATVKTYLQNQDIVCETVAVAFMASLYYAGIL